MRQLGTTHFDESLYKILLKPEIKYVDTHTSSEIFKHCDVYLLDDGFSTIDAHTGSEIFKVVFYFLSFILRLSVILENVCACARKIVHIPLLPTFAAQGI